MSRAACHCSRVVFREKLLSASLDIFGDSKGRNEDLGALRILRPCRQQKEAPAGRRTSPRVPSRPQCSDQLGGQGGSRLLGESEAWLSPGPLRWPRLER